MTSKLHNPTLRSPWAIPESPPQPVRLTNAAALAAPAIHSNRPVLHTPAACAITTARPSQIDLAYRPHIVPTKVISVTSPGPLPLNRPLLRSMTVDFAAQRNAPHNTGPHDGLLLRHSKGR
ncbi:hypothetical protein C8034_v006668 [Colletotrichum sidae]|uniref:Uncharacterized protein n=1 Tax=Colletotrichum sidae TaxID=1347389 RepID=A0A4R8S790_9PEZI|nr:hypothetical protein C8034_v006668 [Colletotrichum sidae]